MSSVHKRKIVRVRKEGAVEDFVPEGQNGIGSVLGLRVDSNRRWLWACSASLPQARSMKVQAAENAGIFKYDLDSGALLKQYLISDSAAAHNFNDIAATGAGDLFITDAASFAVYRINIEREELEIFLPESSIVNTQGITLSPNDRWLFVASYRDGIYKVDTITKEIRRIDHPDEITLYGVDGLYFYRNSLVAIQNGFAPHRVVQYYLDEKLEMVTRARVIERANARFDEPTLGVIVGNQFYYIANSQWRKFNDDGTTPPAEELAEPIVMKATLD